MIGRLLIGLAAVTTPLMAQTIPASEYAARRDSLAARIGRGVVVAFGARTPVGWDRPSQLPAFRYLTGFMEPDAALLIVVRDGRPSPVLFTQARDPRRQLYDGFPPDSLGVERATGIPARSIAALAPMLPDTPKNRAMIAKVRDAVARYDKTGVRIEDNYLVTASGVEWLSRAPREIAEVEAAMAK